MARAFPREDQEPAPCEECAHSGAPCETHEPVAYAAWRAASPVVAPDDFADIPF